MKKTGNVANATCRLHRIQALLFNECKTFTLALHNM